MATFGRWQVADREHQCSECRTAIARQDTYMRLGFVDNMTYEAITRGKDPMHPDIMKRLFDAAMERQYPIKKIHESCWTGAKAAAASVIQKSAAVR